MNIQNKQFTYIGIGCLTIGCLAYFFKQYQEQRDLYRHKMKQAKSLIKQYLGENIIVKTNDNKNNISYICNNDLLSNYLQKNINKKYKRLILIPYVNLQKQKNYNKIYKKNYRNVNPIEIQTIRMNKFQEEQTGRRFNPFQIKGEKYKVQINNCNIERTCLQQKLQPNIIFQQNIKKATNSYNLTYNLSKAVAFSMYGSISYSITHSCFIIEPQFIFLPHNTIDNQFIASIIQYWENKETVSHFKKVTVSLLIFASFYFLVYRGLKSLWKRYVQKKSAAIQGDVNYFINKPCFEATKQGKLICQICKKKNVQIVYQCGHLSLCQECNQLNDKKTCPICKKVSKKQLRIFL